jgi:NAD(P)H-hydrate epimerase
MPPSPVVVTTLPDLPARAADSHKGTYGRVLVVAGSRGMSGAAILCATAALRGGAGLVRVALPEEILPIVASGNPCYMTAPLPQDDQGRLALAAEKPLLDLAAANDVAVVGPGLGDTPATAALVTALVTRTRIPLVLDADALNTLAGRSDLLRGRPGTIATPHPGEFARLLGTSTTQVQQHRSDLAVRFASDHEIVVVLKGNQTVVTDGRRLFVNPTGNPGMATGGSGDVLGGLLAALVGQGLAAFAAAQLGVYLHGLAGDLARDDLGEVSLIASDLLDYMPRAFGNFRGQKSEVSSQK